MGPLKQEIHWDVGACPEKGEGAGEVSGVQVLLGEAEGTRII